MKTISLTEAKRQLPELLQSSEPVTVTRRGEPIGTLSAHITVRSANSRATHRKAARGLLAISARAPVTDREADTGTAELRRMRDRGEY